MSPYPDMPHVAVVSHRDVVVSGVRLHVAEAGDPAAPPLLLVHGWPQHWWQWRELIGPLAADHRVICPDLRGFGWSEVPDSGFEPEVFAADLLGLLDELDIERARTIGHDWGGLASFILCLRHPERVERHLALNIIHPWPRLRPRLALTNGWRLGYQAVMAVPGLSPAALRRATAQVNRGIVATSGDPSCWQHGVVETFTDQLRDPARARATSALYRWALSPRGILAMTRGRYRDLRLRTPTLLLFGVEDFAIDPAALEGYEPHADDMRVELVEGCGHFIVDERPELVLERATAFFGGD